jgi:hypothetical protein
MHQRNQVGKKTDRKTNLLREPNFSALRKASILFMIARKAEVNVESAVSGACADCGDKADQDGSEFSEEIAQDRKKADFIDEKGRF